MLRVSATGDGILDVDGDLRALVGASVTDWSGSRAAPTGYRLEAELGVGGMGVAFLARVEPRAGDVEAIERPGRPPLGARCVIKLILPSMVRREKKVAELSFKKEVVALARLTEKVPPSPFVVRYFDAGLMAVRHVEPHLAAQTLLLPWCAIEFVDGRPLGTTLEDRLASAAGPLEPTRAAALIDGIARGLRAVHAVGLVHRDLKPGNVLVCGEPPHELPKITDFGVARAAGVGDTFDVTVGTTGYAALEQLEGPSTGASDHVGPWSDVFALGAIIYEILTRRPMYDAPSAMVFIGKVLSRGFARLTQVAAAGGMGDAFASNEGQALAARWDELLSRATSPRSPGGGAIGEGVPDAPLRHRDVDELLDELEPLLEATRSLAPISRRRATPTDAPPRAQLSSVERVREVTIRPWEWAISSPLTGDSLIAAACRPDGSTLAATRAGLSFWNGDRWHVVPRRPGDDATAGVLHGGAGAFVVVGVEGEIEVLPGGGGAFTFRLPFAAKHAVALTGHPLGVAHVAMQAKHGEWMIVRLSRRTGVPIARLGTQLRVHAMVRDEATGSFGDDTQFIIAGSALSARADEAYVALVDGRGRLTALPPLPGGAIHALAIDADGSLLATGPGGIGHIDATRAHLTLEEVDAAEDDLLPEALVALADGQVWGFAPGLVYARGEDRVWRIVRREPSLQRTALLAATASGARVYAVHADGRVLAGTMRG